MILALTIVGLLAYFIVWLGLSGIMYRWVLWAMHERAGYDSFGFSLMFGFFWPVWYLIVGVLCLCRGINNIGNGFFSKYHKKMIGDR